jgi:crotonobetainyl-CoA:carnitine CoA-transferase CaiB-like acyl-CoA transferase
MHKDPEFVNVQPLTGIRVIDLTRVLSGPFSTMLLGDMGADVIKIETPQGDTVRGQGAVVNGLSWYFASFNRNKRSVVVDLRKDEGRALLARLLRTADVLVENFRPGVLADMGFTEARLKEINPRLIVASINGYGSTGPYADRPSFDFIAQALSGFMATTGEKDGAPMRAGAPITDLVAGLYCAFGVVNAIRARELTGRGQRVEAAMLNGMVSMLA